MDRAGLRGVRRRPLRWWLRQYVRAYADCSRWLGRQWEPWEQTLEFWDTCQTLRREAVS